MKGATAEILVRISRPPRTIIMRKMGSNQNFFRSRIKDQSSTRVDTVLFQLRCSLFSGPLPLDMRCPRRRGSTRRLYAHLRQSFFALPSGRVVVVPPFPFVGPQQSWE